MTPKISICIPYHDTQKTAFFLQRLLRSIYIQNFTDYEIILTKEGKMAPNTNAALKRAKGELVKIMYMDDFFTDENSLREIVDSIGESKWLVTGCAHYREGEEIGNIHFPEYTDDIHTGNNTIGSPSVLTMRRDSMLLFDNKLSFLLDCDLYRRLHDAYGEPKYLMTPNVIIGLHPDQTSNTMPLKDKQKEATYLLKKYA